MTASREYDLAAIDLVELSSLALLLKARGRINILTAAMFEADTLSVISNSDLDVVVEGSDVTYISSAGLRVILRISRRLAGNGRKLHLCNLKPHIQRVFEMIGFDRVIPIHSDVETALSAISGQAGDETS